MDNISDTQLNEKENQYQAHIPNLPSKRKTGLSGTKQSNPKRGIVAWNLLDIIEDMLILVDEQGAILWVNKKTAKYLRKPPENLTGVYVWDVYPTRKIDHLKILFHEVMTLERPVSFIDKVEDRWIEMLIQLVNNDKGDLEGVAFQARDITAQIEAEESLKHISLQLITVQEDERHRIAQDLHDEIGQQMTALLLELRSVQKAAGTEHPEDANRVQDAIQNLEGIMKGLRQVFYQLYPPSLHNAALNEVLSSLCSMFTRSTGVHVDLSFQEDFPVISNVYEVALYRFVQEGLSNAAKHGKASSVWVNLDAAEDGISISLEDDGLGFDPRKSLSGLGLRGIRERFLALKGGLEVESALGKGTKLFGFLPVETNQT